LSTTGSVREQFVQNVVKGTIHLCEISSKGKIIIKMSFGDDA
jgi:hypothetical protein